jgi:phosphoribosyl 1,2-cyclic phosphate phosphodiesterase
MKIRLLGTGAADGIPGFFINNEVSTYAKKHGGKDLRTRSAALIDGCVKIDLPPDTICQLHRDRLDASDWSALVFTHSHEDHLAVSEIQYALYPFTELEQLPFTIYGNSKIKQLVRQRYPYWPIEFVEMTSFGEYTHADYKITALPANHEIEEECLNLLFERDGVSLLYATDTGIWKEPTFEFLAGRRLNGLVIECTEGFHNASYEGHLNIERLSFVLNRLRGDFAIDENTAVVTTHHAHSGMATHAQLEAALAPIGAEPGYDGCVVEVRSKGG